jgi:hypothetical protein
LLPTLLIGLALVVAGCGGDGGDAPATGTASPAPTPSSTAPPAAPPPPTSSPSPSPTPASTATATPTSPGSLAGPADAGALRSYRYRVEIEFALQGEAGDTPVILGSVEGAYVAPDRHRFTNAFSIGSVRFVQEVVRIGEAAWIRESGGAWRATTPDDAAVVEASALTSADPAFPAGDTPLARDIAVFAGEPVTREGRPSMRYELDRADLLAIDDLFGAGILGAAPVIDEAETFDLRAWIDDQTGALTALELLLVAPAEVLVGDLGIELEPGAPVAYRMLVALSDIDDPEIAIEPPIAGAAP